MKRLPSFLLAGLCLFGAGLPAEAQGQTPPQTPNRDPVVLIANPSVPHLDLVTAQRLYTGRAVEVGGVAVTVVNAAPGSPARERFMASVMAEDDDRYLAYWTVRRAVGKGTPPHELRTAAQVIEFVQATPGGLGYVLASELKPGLKVVLRP
jgi:ABC-type phosphate transport system substrate-binding protein